MAQKDIAIAQIRAMFANIDPGYVACAIDSYTDASELTATQLVQRVSSKLLDHQHGQWPTVLFHDVSRLHPEPGIAARAPKPFLKRSLSLSKGKKGKGRASDPGPGSAAIGSSMLRVDETSTKNVALIQLAEMFPSVAIDTLVQAMSTAPHSYLYLAICRLLDDGSIYLGTALSEKNRMGGVASLPKRINPGEIARHELIRSQEYADSAFALLQAHFPMLWESSIRAVQTESNFDYFRTVQALERLEDERKNSLLSRGWSAFSRMFVGSSANAAVDAPHFSIQSYPTTLGSTSRFCPTLLYELHMHLAGNRLDDLPLPDRPPSKEDMECQCCFSEVEITEMAHCAAGCLFCRSCLCKAVQETVFGQAPLRLHRPKADKNLKVPEDPGSGMGIRCLSIEGCQAAFSDAELQRSLPKHVYRALDQRIAQESLQLAFAPVNASKEARRDLRKCPFCPYQEVEEENPSPKLEWHRMALLQIPLFVILYLSWLFAIAFLPESINQRPSEPEVGIGEVPQWRVAFMEAGGPIQYVTMVLNNALDVHWRKRTATNNSIFRCRNIKPVTDTASTHFSSPTLIESLMPPSPIMTPNGAISSSQYCGRASCTLCHRLYYPGHECSDSKEGLRLALELAATNAVKRQCPECGLGYTKQDGCNKMVCRCDYIMCYICRKGISVEKYKHFCQHPRTPGQPCQSCTNCDLWQANDDVAVKRAVAQAKSDWLKAHPELVKGPGAARVAEQVQNQMGYPRRFVLGHDEKRTDWTLDEFLSIFTETMLHLYVDGLLDIQTSS